MTEVSINLSEPQAMQLLAAVENEIFETKNAISETNERTYIEELAEQIIQYCELYRIIKKSYDTI